ncbi:MAG: hypothetical protein HY253_12565 [Burkholderiales bacterium]|nr:hypothetical protein [Burkholderiales bacterium]
MNFIRSLSTVSKSWLLAFFLVTALLLFFIDSASLPDEQLAPVSRPTTVHTALASGAQIETQIPSSYFGLTEKLANPLERSGDLRHIYEQYKASRNPVERFIAQRAWSACFPAFIAPQGQVFSLEQFSRGLVPGTPETAVRIEAYRRLLGRCKRFSELPRDELVRATEDAQEKINAGVIMSPGQIAEKYWRAGQWSEAMRVVREVIASQDAFAVGTLKDFVTPFWRERLETQTGTSAIRPDIRGQAYAFAACELGLACDAATLSADLMCANEGLCQSGLRTSFLDALPDPNDKRLLQAETRRVIDAVKLRRIEGLGLE